MALAWEDRRGLTHNAASNARNLPELLRLLQRHEEAEGGLHAGHLTSAVCWIAARPHSPEGHSPHQSRDTEEARAQREDDANGFDVRHPVHTAASTPPYLENAISGPSVLEAHLPEEVEDRLASHAAAGTSGEDAPQSVWAQELLQPQDRPPQPHNSTPKPQDRPPRAAPKLLAWLLARLKVDLARRLQEDQPTAAASDRGARLRSPATGDGEGDLPEEVPLPPASTVWLPTSLARLLHALGQLQHHDTELMHLALGGLTEARLRECSGRDLAGIAWGLTRIGYRPTRAWVRKPEAVA